jgi:hypothetical protein
MANQDAPFGFRQVGGLGSRPTSEGTSKYVIASGFADSIYSGDIVEFGAGTSEGGTSIAAGYVGNAAETSSERNVGIFNGCFYEDPTTAKPTWKNYWPASVAAEAEAFVYDNPDDLFEVQSSGTITRAKVGRAVDMGYTEGSTINGRSKEELATTVGSGLALRIIRISEDPSNSDIANDNANWIVKFNEHIYYNYEA